MRASSFDCALCHCTAALRTKQVPAAPIRRYWQSFGYAVDDHHPDFPESFVVLMCARCGLGNYSPRVVGGPDLYEALGRHKFYYEPARWDHGFAASFLQKQNLKSFFEFGCGDGKFLDCVSGIVPKVAGLDFNSAACNSARARGHEVYTDWAPELETPFDAIAMFQTLEHVPDPAELLKHLVALLAPNGCLIIAVPNEDGPLGELSFNPLNAPPHHTTLWPCSALKYIGEAHGLVLETYATEPMNRDLYLSLVDDSLSKTFERSGKLARLALRAMRPAIRMFAATQSVVPGKLPYAGHNHIAIFRKNAA
jgi:SAM-dependent methyltransferase